MVPIALADELHFEPSAAFAFACDPPSLTADNLVPRAFAQIGHGGAPVAVGLRKRVPVGAGLGGGSSDAAAVLRAAMEGAFGAARRARLDGGRARARVATSRFSWPTARRWSKGPASA